MEPSNLTPGFLYLVDNQIKKEGTTQKVWCKKIDISPNLLRELRKGRVEAPSIKVIFSVAKALNVPPYKVVQFCEEYYKRSEDGNGE